ncbi:conserved hypothetical protein [Paraglaciecola sp. T6c]|uniref:DUF2855 family protein n=1 Tax=Pseudoalteromonas atlantica (strain T6c / ATCC BAA-1087) TaxID=3042615 RepID=UPI00005C56AC|nr:DUF2855 family protein [Paraglaciecola sp. T6c]ABG42683.1 conserved hypothetical protein [Paraglaciecola sp. T6c]
MSEFQVKQKQLMSHRLVQTPAIETVEEGQILLKVESFSFTANNITYAMMGDRLGYWQFFPPADNNDKQWGIIPVWGFAQVTQSKAEGIDVGERLFGYFPPAQQVVMTPVNVSQLRLVDGSAHRAMLPPGYNSYKRLRGEKSYNPDFDNERMLLFPLHITSFCLWDRLQDNNWFGAEQVVVISASSKTSLGLGYALSADATAPHSVGLTSNGNMTFVQKVGVYDQVVSYNQIGDIDANKPTVIVDMSGSSDILTTLGAHLGDNLTYCINVGLTHWDEFSAESAAESDRSEFFFAPGHIQKRIKDWGPQGFEQRTMGFLAETAMKCRSWLEVKELNGLGRLAETYGQVCEGNIPPQQGLIIKL